MKTLRGNAPFWRYGDSTRRMRGDLLLSCALLLIPQAVRFGLRPLLLTLAAGLIGVLTELICCLIYRREAAVTDLDSFAIGVLIAMLMPANVVIYVPAAAVFFAVAVAKMPFGGTGRAPLHPVAAGMAFAILCFPDQVFLYADVSAGMMDPNIFVTAEVSAALSPTALLKVGARPELLKPELMAGTVVGPIGTTVTFVTAAAALYLFFRRTASPRITICWMLAACLIAGVAPRVSTGQIDSIMIELSTGSLLFYAGFLATDTATAPKLPLAQCIYGFLGGLVTMMFRYNGVYEQGGCFALLLINATAQMMDRYVWALTHQERRQKPHASEPSEHS